MMSEHTPEEIIELARKQVHTRRAQTQAAQITRERPWRFAFIALLGTLLLGLVAWPNVALNWKLYAVVHGLCAQNHNILLGGLQLPLCVRDTSIYGSVLVTSIYLIARGRQNAAKMPAWPITIMLLLFVVLLGIDGFNSMLTDMQQPHLYAPRYELRILTGVGMGTSIAVLIFLMFNLSLRHDPDTEQRIIGGWLELGGALLLNLIYMPLIYSNSMLLYWPVAISSWLGMVGVLYLVNLLLSALFMGYEGKVAILAQLIRPATIAILLTITELSALSGLRYWLEAQGLIAIS